MTIHVYNDWHMQQVNFVLAYPQAKVSHDVYMLPPEKFICDANGLKHSASAPSPWQQKYRLKLVLQNLHGLKDAGATWFNHLTKELKAMNFQQGLVDPCLFFRDGIV